MRLHPSTVVGLALAATLTTSWADRRPASPPPLATFSGAIGVDPLTAAGGADTVNTVRGIAPGGRAWTMRKLQATVAGDGSVRVAGRGLLFTSGELIGTRGTVANVIGTLVCGPADATARKFNTPPAALDAAGNFSIQGKLTEDGTNAAVLPATCDNPVLLIRSFNATTGAAGGWFAAGIPGGDKDD